MLVLVIVTGDRWQGQVKHNWWHMTGDTWQVIHDTWHVTSDMWHSRRRWLPGGWAPDTVDISTGIQYWCQLWLTKHVVSPKTTTKWIHSGHDCCSPVMMSTVAHPTISFTWNCCMIDPQWTSVLESSRVNLLQFSTFRITRTWHKILSMTGFYWWNFFIDIQRFRF